MKKVKHIITENRLAQITILLVLLIITVIITTSGYNKSDLQLCNQQVIVNSGDTLYDLLSGQGISPLEIQTIAKVLKSGAGISGLRADSDKIIFSRIHDNAPISKIILIPNPWKQIELSCNDGEWSSNILEIKPDTRAVYKFGEIHDGDSFYSAGLRAGMPSSVLADVYDLLSFEIDFERDVRAGQKFSVMYEENYSSAQKIDNGNVVSISFDALRGNVKMYRFKKSDGKIGYYDENGNGAIKSLKRTPINNARVTSGFSMHRKHPVLGYTRAHKGVDFRASTGTPIPSSGDGVVVARSYNGGHGNFIKIRHNGTFQTLYGHLSRFVNNVKVGTHVKQGQIIGYAGMTGLATGPHLHYEVIKNGQNVNPLTVKLPAIDNLSTSDKNRFLSVRKLLDSSKEKIIKNPNLFIQM